MREGGRGIGAGGEINGKGIMETYLLWGRHVTEYERGGMWCDVQTYSMGMGQWDRIHHCCMF